MLGATGVSLEELYRHADVIRKNHMGDEVFIRGIIEFSNICVNDCLYCGIRASNRAVARYVMSLSKRQSSNDALGAKSELFYTSNCGGCHGNDGKGLGGAFPDLTLKRYVGLEKRKAFLEIKTGSL